MLWIQATVTSGENPGEQLLNLDNFKNIRAGKSESSILTDTDNNETTISVPFNILLQQLADFRANYDNAGNVLVPAAE